MSATLNVMGNRERNVMACQRESLQDLGRVVARWIGAVAVALGLAGPVVAQETATDGLVAKIDSVLMLMFEWEPGLSAEVEMAQRMVRQGEGNDSDVTMRSTFRMDVSEHESGLLVLNHDGRLVGIESDPELPPDNFLHDLYSALSGVDAGYIVSLDGEFLDVVGADEAAEAFRAAMAPVFDSGAAQEELAPLMQTFEQMLTPELMRVSAADQWGGMIWTWAWEEFEIGAVYSLEGEAPSPLLPDIMIPMEYELGFLERVPCEEGSEDARGCVRLELYSYPDPESVMAFMDEFMRRVGPLMEEGAIEFKSFEQENHLVVVLDPMTMVPFRYRTSKSISGVMAQDGTDGSFSRLDETELTFRYR
jgi:hypothetical protein